MMERDLKHIGQATLRRAGAFAARLSLIYLLDCTASRATLAFESAAESILDKRTGLGMSLSQIMSFEDSFGWSVSSSNYGAHFGAMALILVALLEGVALASPAFRRRLTFPLMVLTFSALAYALLMFLAAVLLDDYLNAMHVVPRSDWLLTAFMGPLFRAMDHGWGLSVTLLYSVGIGLVVASGLRYWQVRECALRLAAVREELEKQEPQQGQV
jgi:hypothetical protein